MDEKSKLLLSSRFYAYVKGGSPWGLPGELWSEAPHLVVLFDELICDEEAFKAEKLAHQELKWVTSGLFVELKNEGILQPVNMREVVLNLTKPDSRRRIPDLDVIRRSLRIGRIVGRRAAKAKDVQPARGTMCFGRPG